MLYRLSCIRCDVKCFVVYWYVHFKLFMIFLISLVLIHDASFIVLGVVSGVGVSIPLIVAARNACERNVVLYVWYGLLHDDLFCFYGGFHLKDVKQLIKFTNLNAGKSLICILYFVANSFLWSTLVLLWYCN